MSDLFAGSASWAEVIGLGCYIIPVRNNKVQLENSLLKPKISFLIQPLFEPSSLRYSSLRFPYNIAIHLLSTLSTLSKDTGLLFEMEKTTCISEVAEEENKAFD